ncbi:MAG: S-layer homology domain-containing protein [Fimbriimonadaceae bacterium]
MRLALVALAVAVPMLGQAQISTLRHDLPQIIQIQRVVGELKILVLFGYPDGLINYGRPASRADYSQASWQLVNIIEKQLADGKEFEWYVASALRYDFWMFKWLGETLVVELARLADDYDERVEAIKQGLAKHGIIVEDPYARFADVPEGHWADVAIHNLRRTGIIRGYPDNTFRF